MNNGWIKLWRKLLKSSVFGHEGMLKLWILCLLKANHEEAEVMFPGLLSPIKLMPGQFITGRDSLHYDYHQGNLNKRYCCKLPPSPKTLFRWLENLEKLQNLSIKKTNKYSIVSVSNWHEHQESVPQVSSQVSNKCPQTRSIKKNKEDPSAFFSLRERYNQELIDRVFQAFASCRKLNKVADSILLVQLQTWEKYPVGQVESAIKVYLEKDYAGQGKAEAYLLGIIRNQKAESKQPKQQSTGSALLDSYYANTD